MINYLNYCNYDNTVATKFQVLLSIVDKCSQQFATVLSSYNDGVYCYSRKDQV